MSKELPQSSQSEDESVKADSKPKGKDGSSKSAGKTKKSKSKTKKQQKKKETPPPKPLDNQQSFERDPEVERILNEVVETLNRNQTPIQRKIPSRVVRKSHDHYKEEDVRSVSYTHLTLPTIYSV